jgi:hypothetical protein
MENCPHLHSSCRLAVHTAGVTGGSDVVSIHTDPESIITIYRWLVATKNFDVELHSGGIFIPTKVYTPHESGDCSYSLMVITLMSAIVFMFMCWMLFKTRLSPRVEPMRPNFRVPVVPFYAESPEFLSLNSYMSESDNEDNPASCASSESDITVTGHGKQSPVINLNHTTDYSPVFDDVKSSTEQYTDTESDQCDTDLQNTQRMLAYDAVVAEMYSECNARLSSHTHTSDEPSTSKKNT